MKVIGFLINFHFVNGYIEILIFSRVKDMVIFHEDIFVWILYGGKQMTIRSKWSPGSGFRVSGEHRGNTADRNAVFDVTT